MPAKSLTLENGRKVSGAYARAAPIRLLGASSGAQRASARLPKLLSGDLSVAEATGNRDLQVQPGMPKP